MTQHKHVQIVPWHNSTFQIGKSITENISKGLKVQQPETTKFYIRPKIYKTGNLGHPVAISVNCYTNTNGICNEYNLCPSIRKYLHGTIWKTAYISVHKLILYLRIINDIFIIWKGTKQEPLVFLENLSSKHKTIKLGQNISHSSISFFDTLVDKDKINTLQRTIYRKPLDQQPASMHIQTIKVT